MKKILALLLAGLLAVSMVACGDKDDEEENEKESSVVSQNYVEETNKKGKFEYTLTSDGYEIVKYEPYSVTAADITLPKEVNGRDVVGIAAGAFEESASSIKSVIVPDTYKYIGDNAFYDCDALVSVTLPATLESIGVGAFRDCDVLASFTMPTSVTEISEYAFMNCKSIKTLDLSNVKVINKGAFHGCTTLESIIVSDKIEYATKEAFYDCNALVYNVEAGLKYLGNDANKTVLLVSPTSLNIDECAVSATTKVIADAAFNNCQYLTKVTLSDSIKVINGTSFENCPELKYNKSENGLYLGTEANPYMVLIDLDIRTVEDFKLNKDVKIIAGTAFAKCTLLEDISFEGTEEAWKAITKPDAWNGDLTVNVTCSDKVITVLG